MRAFVVNFTAADNNLFAAEQLSSCKATVVQAKCGADKVGKISCGVDKAAIAASYGAAQQAHVF